MHKKIYTRILFTAVIGIASLALSLRASANDAAPEPKKIEVVAKRFAYEPADVTLKKGEPVVIELTSLDVAHGVKFKELNLSTVIKKDGKSELAFTPTEVGDFVGHCSVFCGSGHGTMTLTLHVRE
jgi:cytochrome c oxidase subunit II